MKWLEAARWRRPVSAARVHAFRIVVEPTARSKAKSGKLWGAMTRSASLRRVEPCDRVKFGFQTEYQGRFLHLPDRHLTESCK